MNDAARFGELIGALIATYLLSRLARAIVGVGVGKAVVSGAAVGFLCIVVRSATSSDARELELESIFYCVGAAVWAVYFAVGDMVRAARDALTAPPDAPPERETKKMPQGATPKLRIARTESGRWRAGKATFDSRRDAEEYVAERDARAKERER